MAIINDVLNIDEFATQPLLRLENRPAGTYEVKMIVAGNSILSSLFIRSMDPGATIKVNYWDTTTGQDVGERFDLEGHNLFTAPQSVVTDRIIVTRIHNKPNLEVIVSGGSVEFGVYATVVAEFASDLDSALHLDGDVVNVAKDKGLPIVCRNTDTGLWELITCPFPVTLDETGDAFRHKDIRTVTDNTTIEVINETVPVGKTWKLTTIRLACRSHANYALSVDGDIIMSGRTGPASPTDTHEFIPREEVAAGSIVKVEFCKIAGPSTAVETYLTGFEE